MFAGVTAFFSWIALYLPDFLMSHPVIDILAVAVSIWVIALVARLLRTRF